MKKHKTILDAFGQTGNVMHNLRYQLDEDEVEDKLWNELVYNLDSTISEAIADQLLYEMRGLK